MFLKIINHGGYRQNPGCNDQDDGIRPEATLGTIPGRISFQGMVADHMKAALADAHQTR